MACLSCPLIFLIVFAMAHPLLGVDMGNTANFDHTTPAAAFGEFTQGALKLLIAGVAVGAVCGLFVMVAFRVAGQSRLAPQKPPSNSPHAP